MRHLNPPSLSSQVYHDSEEGQRYIQFYKLNKFPYISILDPRTGEQRRHTCFTRVRQSVGPLAVVP